MGRGGTGVPGWKRTGTCHYRNQRKDDDDFSAWRDYESCREDVQVVGNIGTAYTSVALDTTEKTVTVAEVSSFQLETIETFHPRASAITNITEDHLNRHHTMDEYIRVKERITENQTMDDACVLNYEDEILRAFGEKLIREQKVRVIFFSSQRELEEGIYYRDGEIYLARDGKKELVVRTDDLKILGLHNFENVMTAVAMAYDVACLWRPSVGQSAGFAE